MGKTLKQTSFLLNGEILNAFQLRSRVSRVHDSTHIDKDLQYNVE